ncbi:hypothetical protein FVE85_3330 [Porphyridium purpureum]|uniref:Uncharacterized protein n=1 Tax=Porphyridium purpureum TaxID=35688 RepID=A0A5J4YUB0_PORPP|nr:hypothetical protein FVE85_3330 [Porphyridium purpureum]|eukprot:POR3795..scf227_4
MSRMVDGEEYCREFWEIINSERSVGRPRGAIALLKGTAIELGDVPDWGEDCDALRQASANLRWFCARAALRCVHTERQGGEYGTLATRFALATGQNRRAGFEPVRRQQAQVLEEVSWVDVASVKNMKEHTVGSEAPRDLKELEEFAHFSFPDNRKVEKWLPEQKSYEGFKA